MATSVDTSRTLEVGTKVRTIPGEPGIWVFVLLDMSIFAWMFGIFAWYRAEHGELFRSSQMR